ncbi:MAG: HAD family hydrolase [Desulfobacteraceae bacterium]|jgi:HAD superfamily hydrolase (TIGR01490 family)
MKNNIAFFDVDETIIRIKSMIDFQKYYFFNHPELGENEYNKYFAQMTEWMEKYDRNIINRKFYETFKGRNKAVVESMAVEWYRQLKLKKPNLFIEGIMRAIRFHKENGDHIVLLSGSSLEILSPLAKDLDIHHVLATNLEISSGVFTGRIVPPQIIGKGKAIVLQSFLDDMGYDYADCYAYGDHISDLYMLELAGTPHVVSGDTSLEKIARRRKWKIIEK